MDEENVGDSAEPTVFSIQPSQPTETSDGIVPVDQKRQPSPQDGPFPLFINVCFSYPGFHQGNGPAGDIVGLLFLIINY